MVVRVLERVGVREIERVTMRVPSMVARWSMQDYGCRECHMVKRGGSRGQVIIVVQVCNTQTSSPGSNIAPVEHARHTQHLGHSRLRLGE